VVAQFDCHPEQALFAQRRDLGEPRDASRTSRRNNRAFGSLPYQSEPLPAPEFLEFSAYISILTIWNGQMGHGWRRYISRFAVSLRGIVYFLPIDRISGWEDTSVCQRKAPLKRSLNGHPLTKIPLFS
jgi:hypothetical protein